MPSKRMALTADGRKMAVSTILTLSATERRAKILEILDTGGRARLSDLAAHFSVSGVTIHRDLEALAKAGLVERVRGGATALGNGSRVGMTGWTQRTRDAVQEKSDIAKYARRYITDGTTIFLDASTTCLALAFEIELSRFNALTIVTNSPAIAHQVKSEHVHIIVCPGEVDQTLGMIGGPFTNVFLERLNFSASFVSAAGIAASALSTSRPAVTEVVKTVVANSDLSYCLIQSSKFGRGALMEIMSPAEFEAVIVDAGLSDRQVSAFRSSGINIEIAGDEGARSPTTATSEKGA